MKNLNTRVYARNGKHGVDLFLDISGIQHYLVTRRSNDLLLYWLKDGISLGELSRIKPSRNKAEQKRYHYAKYIMKIVNEYITHELAA